LITTRDRCWPMYLDDGRTPSNSATRAPDVVVCSGLPPHGFQTERTSQFERFSLKLGGPFRGDAPAAASLTVMPHAGRPGARERALWHGFCSLEDRVLG